ncbi:MAG: hypothetical protein U1D67_10555, partial [Dehalococcoidia bacterium]|nr:hypothetical protein [Dehalococcoidia bacterium]
VVFSQHGWWQPCPELNLPGYNPYTDEGSNINNLVPTVEVDPVDGSIPYKSYLCRVSKLAT